VIGASAGGWRRSTRWSGNFRRIFGLPFLSFSIWRLKNTGAALLHRLSRHKTFECALAVDGEKFVPGRIYISPPDSHLLLKAKHILVAKGGRENRYRPGIDPLFRSAAATHGSHVIGVLLTGMLDDGTVGLIAVKKCGGITVVQDPGTAPYPDAAKCAE
jgi:two-component system, chemotaxis family, protein-glutamate methylesterase/glutaminase